MMIAAEKKIACVTSVEALLDRASLPVSPWRRRVGRRLAWPLGQVAEDVFHHDHGGIDDEAEIDGADRQQVGGFPAQHQDEPTAKKQREGDGRRRRSARCAGCRGTATG